MKSVVIIFAVFHAVFASDGGELRETPYPLPRLSSESLNFNSDERIYDGEIAPEGKFPYMVLIIMRDRKKNELFRCSGSLVAKDWVLLAGHCILDESTVRDYILVGGKASLRPYLKERTVKPFEEEIEDSEYGVQERRISAYYVHPQYDRHTLYYDVALLKLKTQFNDSVTIQNLSSDKLVTNNNCTILGWGLSRGNNFDGNLKYIEEKPVVSPHNGCIHKREGPFLCLKRVLGGICQGDSGSPLVCANLTWGVASHYVTTASRLDCGLSMEEYYSDIYSSREWIKSHIGAGTKLVPLSASTMIVVTFLFYLTV